MGIKSDQDFWNNKNQAQERALDEFMRRMEGNVGRNLDFRDSVNGRRILKDAQGGHPPLVITDAGLMAAAHRAGQGWVDVYLNWLKQNGWESYQKNPPATVPFPHPEGRPYTPAEIDAWLRRVETRMRLFENVPYQRLTNPKP